LATVLGSNDVPFEVHWDSYGFPGVTRSYAGFWAAADEEARSRVYGGIHFSFDNAAGQGIGRNVAHYVMDHFLVPRERPSALAAPGQVSPGPFSQVVLTTPLPDGPSLTAAGTISGLPGPSPAPATGEPAQAGEDPSVGISGGAAGTGSVDGSSLDILFENLTPTS